MRSVCPDHTRYMKDCPKCPIYSRIYRRTRHREVKAGTWTGAMWRGAKLEEVRAHVRALLGQPGVFAPQVAQAAGVFVSVVYKLNRAETSSVHPVIGGALLALRPEGVLPRVERPELHVDGTGARRRLQALAVDGWDAETLDPLCGIHRSELCRHRRGDRVLIRAANRDKIIELYEKIQSQADPTGTSTRIRRIARDAGWAPPECWTDETIDDPSAEPLPLPPDTDDWVAVTRQIEDALVNPAPGKAAEYPRAVKAEIARHAHRRLGWTYQRIAELLGFKSANAVEYMLNGRRDRPKTRKG